VRFVGQRRDEGSEFEIAHYGLMDGWMGDVLIAIVYLLVSTKNVETRCVQRIS
jgi:hypothetical protein